jgi:hypothetical protein
VLFPAYVFALLCCVLSCIGGNSSVLCDPIRLETLLCCVVLCCVVYVVSLKCIVL